jgi:hypothetical protein
MATSFLFSMHGWLCLGTSLVQLIYVGRHKFYAPMNCIRSNGRCGNFFDFGLFISHGFHLLLSLHGEKLYSLIFFLSFNLLFVFFGFQWQSSFKQTPTLGIGVPMKSWMFKEWFQRSKFIIFGLVPYTIGKLLRHKCLKWAYMIHLSTYNTSYGWMKGRESKWQFDSQLLKVKDRLELRACRWHATYCWKALDQGYNFALDLVSIRGLCKKLWASIVVEVPVLGILGLPTWESWEKWHLDEAPMANHIK